MKYIRNNRGFTLIELMATLAILAMIVLIAVPAVGSIINNADESAEANSIKMIEKAGSLADVGGLEHDRPGEYDVSTLVDAGYLDLDITDALMEGYVTQSGNGNAYTYNGEVISDTELTPESDFEYAFLEDVLSSAGITWEQFLNADPYEASYYGSEDAVLITGYTGVSDSVVIPESIDGRPVAVILDEVFKGKGLISVDLPDSLRYIAHEAFRDNQLTSINLPDSLVEIDQSAFRDNQLTSVDIPESVIEVHNNAFTNNHLSSAYVPGSTFIYYGVFFDNPGMTLYGSAESNASEYGLMDDQSFEYLD